MKIMNDKHRQTGKKTGYVLPYGNSAP